ncbi:helix-turn-helix transcriptional regulator [Spirosoma sp. KNUC1025]|uniref:ArsR/SmtB family transcription factor n=1 Tax=Spirosoma sp. KNUC1025 TaxID=2894082 RepID=UPI00386F2A9C|nr:ArsR family transcriptional regulator [Spirosoma sp. KNUC1025]
MYTTPSMTDSKIDQVAAAIEAIAHPSRLQILLALSETQSLPASALQHHLQLSVPVLSSHLTHLTDQRLLSLQQQDNEPYYSLANTSLQKVVALIQTTYL